MKFEIKHRWFGSVLFSLETDSLKLTVEAAARSRADLRGADLRGADLRDADLWGADLRDVNLRGADLWGADLRGADLWGADLRGANLRGANLRDADLRDADLRDVNLRGADLWGADLRDADLRGADLWDADLRGADLWGADLRDVDLRGADLRGADLWGADLRDVDLRGANLWGADLRGAKCVIFSFFPSIRLLSSISLGQLPDDLTVELMRRDAIAHPEPEKFDAWAEGGGCPYGSGVEQFWRFAENCELWKPGPPEILDRDLIVAICKSKNWGIKGYLERTKTEGANNGVHYRKGK